MSKEQNYNNFLEEIFSQSGEFKIKSDNRLLACNVTPNMISIRDITEGENKLYYIYARVTNDFKFIVNVQTGYNLIPHPDLFAKRIIKRAFQFFESNGLTINHYVSHWESSSDMYHQYFTFLENYSHATYEDAENAVKNTWTGKLVQELGFNKISRLHYGELFTPQPNNYLEKPEIIEIEFSR